MVTHNPNLTTYATRVIHMLDGGIDEDIKTVADENLPTRVDIKFAPLKKVEKSKKDTLKSKTEQKIEKTQKTAHKTLEKTKPKVNVPEKSTSKNSPNLSSKTTKSQQTSSKTKHFTYNSDPSVRIVPKPSIEDLVKKEKRS